MIFHLCKKGVSWILFLEGMGRNTPKVSKAVAVGFPFPSFPTTPSGWLVLWCRKVGFTLEVSRDQDVVVFGGVEFVFC